VRAYVSTLKFAAAGAKPYFQPAEVALLYARAQQAGAAGVGVSRTGMREQARGMAAALAAALPVGAERQRLEGAKFSAKFMRQAAKVATGTGLIAAVSARKTSAVIYVLCLSVGRSPPSYVPFYLCRLA
jgi:hypothetical protein